MKRGKNMDGSGWLYNSSGDAIAYKYDDFLYNSDEKLIGWSPDSNRHFYNLNGDYIGSICKKNRLYHLDDKSGDTCCGSPSAPSYVGYFGYASYESYDSLPLGAEDVSDDLLTYTCYDRSKSGWLYNSSGDAIAYQYESYLYDSDEKLIGWCPDDDGHFYNLSGDYIGSVYAGNRLYHFDDKSGNTCCGSPSAPSYIGYFGYASYESYDSLPSGAEDVPDELL